MVTTILLLLKLTIFLLRLLAQYCEGGQVDPYKIAERNGERDIIFSHTYEGLTAGEACCVCGGGIDISELSDSLLEWKLVIYGEVSAEGDPITLSPAPTPFSSSLSPVDKSSNPTILTPTAAPLPFSFSPILTSSFSPSFSSVNESTSPTTSFPTAVPFPVSFPPFQVEGEIITKVANGDTYFFRNALPQLTQPSPMEETMLVRSGKAIQADAFSLISFPFQGLLGLGIVDVNSSSFESREVLTDICLSHLQNVVEGKNASTYTLCRVKPSSWNVADGDGSDLETYQGIELAGMKMPYDCMGEELNLISFEVLPNDTSVCVEISDLLVLPTSSSSQRQDIPSTSDTNEDIIMFLIDAFDQEQELEDRFYTFNSDRPPLMVFYKASTEPPTFSGEISTVPVETQLPTPSPSLLNANEPDPMNKNLFKLLALLLLCPLLCFWFVRRIKPKTVFEDVDETENLHVEEEVLFQQDSNSGVGHVQTDPCPPNNEHGASQDSSSDSNKDETTRQRESGEGHTSASDAHDSLSSSSPDGDSNTNDDTFEDELSSNSDDESNASD
jgi:hypothetical protein